MMNVKDIFLTY